MEENYKLEREYKISLENFREGYLAYQKKYVYLKSYIFSVIFLVLAVDFIVAAFKDPNNIFAYVLIMLCLAFAFREWYNPRKIRRSLVDTVAEMGEPIYKIAVADSYVDISTVSVPEEIEEPDDEADENGLPEPTRIPIDNELSVLEYDKLFLLVYGKSVFYIVPKDGFSAEEIEIIKGIGK